MQMAEPDEESFFKKHRSRTPAAAQERFDDELWTKHVVHHQQDPLLTVIFATIAPAVIGTRSQPLASFGVDASKLREACVTRHGVSFLPGPRCALPSSTSSPGRAHGPWASRGRVCFAFLEEEQMVEAGRRLGRAIAEAAREASGGSGNRTDSKTPGGAAHGTDTRSHTNTR
jgi:hypothetical protein